MRNIIIGICLAFLLASCQKEEQLDATFTMEVKGFVEEECYTFGEPQALYLWSSKSWADGNVSQVTYEVDPTLLEEYNQESGTSYKLLPDTCYWMENSNFNVDDEAVYAKFKVMYSPESIIASGGHYNELEYALPMRLLVNGVPMSKERGSVIVAFRVNEPILTIQRSGLVEQVYTFDPERVYELSMPFAVNYSNKEWINLTFEIDNEFVEEYNAENGTSYLPFPQDNPDYVTWIAEDGELERDVKKDSLTVYADMQGLESGKQYMLAMKLSSISSTKAKIDPENFRRYVIFAEIPKIEQSNWTVRTSSTQEGNAGMLADDDLSNFWVWSYSGNKLPENITYMLNDFNSLAVVRGIELHPRFWQGWLGPKDMEIYITTDSEHWEKVMDYTVNLNPDGTMQTEPYKIILPQAYECLGVRISITSHHSVGIGFHEIYMLGEITENPNPPVIIRNDILQESWSVTTSSSDGTNPGTVLNDYDYSKHWVWDWSKKNFPENITYTLLDQNQTATVDSIVLYPVGSGGWRGPKDMEIQIDKDGSGNWETVQTFVAPDLATFAWENGYSIVLDQSVACKSIRISISDFWSDGIAFREIVMYGKLE